MRNDLVCLWFNTTGFRFLCQLIYMDMDMPHRHLLIKFRGNYIYISSLLLRNFSIHYSKRVFAKATFYRYSSAWMDNARIENRNTYKNSYMPIWFAKSMVFSSLYCEESSIYHYTHSELTAKDFCSGCLYDVLRGETFSINKTD